MIGFAVCAFVLVNLVVVKGIQIIPRQYCTTRLVSGHEVIPAITINLHLMQGSFTNLAKCLTTFDFTSESLWDHGFGHCFVKLAVLLWYSMCA